MNVLPFWTNSLRSGVAAGLAVTVIYVTAIIYFGFSPLATDVGYAPPQPVAYSHAAHAGKLGMDCRYCHISVESSAHANVPATQTCMNCHANIHNNMDNTTLALIRNSYTTGSPVPWVKVHDLPDYAYFNHSAHVTRGVGCATCHGRIDQMEVVYQDKPLNMAWCLECHRNPERFLRPLDKITDMAWNPTPEEQLRIGREVRQTLNLNPPQDCSACHR
jgi:hypothetical protein